PRVRQVSKRQGKRITIISPMFPRYLFIRLDDQSDNWGPIRSTIGVASLVRFGALPAQVPDRLISGLQEREDEAGVQPLPEEGYRPGSRVRITEGSLAGYEGVLLAKSGRDRVVL